MRPETRVAQQWGLAADDRGEAPKAFTGVIGTAYSPIGRPLYAIIYHHLLASARSTHSRIIFQASSGPVMPRTMVPPFFRSL